MIKNWKLVLTAVALLFILGCKSEGEDIENAGHEEITEPGVIAGGDTDEDKPEQDKEEVAIESDAKFCLTDFAAYLFDPGEEFTNIRCGPGGEVIMELEWVGVEEEYMVQVIGFEKGWFKIDNIIFGMEEDIEVLGEEVWIHHSVVACDTRNYGGQKINLYQDPDESSQITGSIDFESGGLRPIEACGEWVLIELSYDDYYRKGWMKSNWLCGNPLTTCA